MISAVMPNFNHGKYLPRALSALLDQGNLLSEIIVVDDGSTDDSVAVVEGFQRQHGSVRLIRHDVNRGAPAALNTGLAASTGEFVFFPAADDFVFPDLLRRAEAGLRAAPHAALYCAEVVAIDTDGRVVGFRPFMSPSASAGYLSPADVRAKIEATDNWIVGPSVVYRRALLQAIGGFDEQLGAFCDGMAVRQLAFERGFVFEPEVLASWMVHPGSLSARSALTLETNKRLLARMREQVVRRFPADVRAFYGDLLDRRLRFSMARLWLVWHAGRPNTDAIADVLRVGGFDRAVLKMLAAIPGIGRSAVLAWMALRLRPFRLTAVLQAMISNWRRDRSRRAAAQRLLAQIPKA